MVCILLFPSYNSFLELFDKIMLSQILNAKKTCQKIRKIKNSRNPFTMCMYIKSLHCTLSISQFCELYLNKAGKNWDCSKIMLSQQLSVSCYTIHFPFAPLYPFSTFIHSALHPGTLPCMDYMKDFYVLQISERLANSRL